MTVLAPTALYRFYDAQGVLLYVGISGDLTSRWRSHSDSKPWWKQVASHSLTWFDQRGDAEEAEREAIQDEKPVHNVIYSRSAGQPPRFDLSPTCTDPALAGYMNLNGAAEVLGVSPQYVHRLAERGELVGAKIGSSWVFRRVTVERYDRQRKGGPPAEA